MNKTRRPRPEKSASPVKLFTLEQANATLPLVRRVAEDLAEEFQRVRTLEEQAKASTPGPQREALREQYHLRVDVLRELADELQDIGCELKDPRIGLIDFHAMHESRVVNLCWKLGEQNITHWHETSEGFSGRRELDAEFGK